jgi:hypothetical protein
VANCSTYNRLSQPSRAARRALAPAPFRGFATKGKPATRRTRRRSAGGFRLGLRVARCAEARREIASGAAAGGRQFWRGRVAQPTSRGAPDGAAARHREWIDGETQLAAH